MYDPDSQNFISSKEILEKTGISRATLNNYIKIGIIPRPVVRKPVNEVKRIKRLGYFPTVVLDYIDQVKTLKKQGKTLEEVARQITKCSINENIENGIQTDGEHQNNIPLAGNQSNPISGTKAALILEDISYPSYFLDYDFSVIWINDDAEDRILNQKVSQIKEMGSRTIFRLFFGPEFQSNIKNWLDLVAIHIPFVKLRFSRMWLPKLFKGINQDDQNILEALFDDTPPPQPQEPYKIGPL
ncbi:hypothetical protein ACFL1Z_08845 [Thermodesulfobacteriota bacterium]